MKHKISILIFSLTFVFSISNPQRLLCSTELKDIFNNLRKIKQWKVEFDEEVFEQKGIIQRKSGDIQFQAPLTFRISYKNSYIISDGNLLQFVFPDKKKVYTKKLSDSVSENLIIQILSGSDEIINFFEINSRKKGVYELIPKENSIKNVSKIMIYTTEIGFPIDKVEIFSKEIGIRMKVKKVSYKNFNIDIAIPDGFEEVKDF
ncbi:MAG: outer membrane lipoprotein carrier protein LolA [Candidatus Calescibacterium sp.]|nr:outer membrane lipoprotein carrier protein LolA [Candidatus Calescibacterium sp.]MCX7733965.1 outer membrane lipoprotein carrier protein LolA [bacterium]MDW8086436.1 outer membrane lipoprotein carrier protein LolA [Candidatus Calescibacterium sp.]